MTHIELYTRSRMLLQEPSDSKRKLRFQLSFGGDKHMQMKYLWKETTEQRSIEQWVSILGKCMDYSLQSIADSRERLKISRSAITLCRKPSFLIAGQVPAIHTVDTQKLGCSGYERRANVGRKFSWLSPWIVNGFVQMWTVRNGCSIFKPKLFTKPQALPSEVLPTTKLY